MKIFALALKLSIDLEHINFVELLSSKLDVLVVKDVELLLKLGQLGD